MLDTQPQRGQRRAQFVDIIAGESRKLSARINEALRQYADALKATLTLEDMRATDLLEFARQRIADALGIPTVGKSETQLKIDIARAIDAAPDGQVAAAAAAVGGGSARSDIQAAGGGILEGVAE